ncbi:PD-(D/E)XK nuclease family protein [Micrococcus sp. M4NT]|uniref:cytochrome n=1 Tax=Micrococcus sp. M4NT TaxID=2957501 RepID=UPI0029B924EF|nr:cytochrome [Micrococcus sp. M4NT]MDX2340940.1 PD-(D/E)XK nuclease family protein [Micrococcus sp. M4NT]
MTQPRLAHQTPSGRMYARSLSGLPEVPSITTVIGMEKTDLDGWIGWMAADAVVKDERLAQAVGSSARLREVARQSADAAARFRDAAAERGDRVHDYAEQVSRRALGQPHTMAEARAALIEQGEGAYADRFDEWWDLYDVRPVAAEITVWNHTVGYAGTLDLVARIGGRLCLIDYKTKGTGRDGRVKALDPKVVMQLTAGLKAEESLVDAEAGTWEPWQHGGAEMLLGVALGETEVAVHQANPAVLPRHWHKFWALRQVWTHAQAVADAGPALRVIGPPPVAVPAASAGGLEAARAAAFGGAAEPTGTGSAAAEAGPADRVTA